MKYLIIIALALLAPVAAFSQGTVYFDINFGANPPPHTPGDPDSGATLTGGLFYSILYLSDAAPTSGSIVEELPGGTFATVFQFTDSVYASYPGGGPAVDYEQSWQLTDPQIQALLAGQWYAQVTYSDATYLGQITAVPEPSTDSLLLGGMLAVSAGWYRRFALRKF